MATLDNIRGSSSIDVCDIIARIEELLAQRTPRFVAGWNMEGYMPDSEPAEFDNFDDAKQYVLDELQDRQDNEDIEDHAEDLAAFAEDVNLESEPFSQTILGYAYWVTEDGVMGLDDDETEELAALEALMADLVGNGGDEQWQGAWYPLTLIRDGEDFVDAMKEMCQDIGDIPDNVPSYIEIDWEKTADNLRADYTEIEIDGVTYLYR